MPKPKIPKEAKFAFKEVDRLIIDPRSYELPKEAKIPYNRKSALRTSIFRWHKTNDLNAQLAYLDKAFKQWSWSGLEDFREQLLLYTQSYEALKTKLPGGKVTFALAQKNFLLKIPNSSGTYYLNGQISRIDITKYGRAIWLFDKDLGGWQNKNKYPLLQSMYCEDKGVPLAEVTIGVYDFNLQEHDWISYNKNDVSIAENNFQVAFDVYLKKFSPMQSE